MCLTEVAARIGWLAGAGGALYLLLAVLAARIPDIADGERVDKQGAFAELAGSPFGGWLLGAVAVGLASFAAVRLWAAARGTDEKPSRRLAWAGSAVVYASLAVLAFGVLRGAVDSGGGGNDEKALTTRLLTWPGDRLLVGAIALVVLAVAASFVRKAIKERFLRDIDEGAVPDRLQQPVRVLGVVGWLGRAVAWSLVGFFLLRSATQHDPNEPVGLDESLHALMAHGWGVTLLWAAGDGGVA